MKLVIFGLAVNSPWGNGHATLWRGLCRALGAAGHCVVFFERDRPSSIDPGDLRPLPGVDLVRYRDWESVRPRARRELADADAGMVTSSCPDGLAATELLGAAPCLRTFYDLDTPVTLHELSEHRKVGYIGPRGLSDFDFVLSVTGGTALDELRRRLGARHVAALYRSVDPEASAPTPPRADLRSDLSFLGPDAPDQEADLEELFLRPAERLPERRFRLAGTMDPGDFPARPNVDFHRDLPPAAHPAFLCSSRLTLNLTSRALRERGYCPSGRLFEAAACGVPVITEPWEGLDCFFEPRSEILPVRTADDVRAALEMSDAELRRLAHAARERALADHSAHRRADQLVSLLAHARSDLLATA